MNYPYHQPYLSQQNLRIGVFTVLATAALIGMEGRLVEVARISSGGNTGKLGVDLPNANTDTQLYVLVEGGAAGEKVKVAPIIEGESYKLRVNGTAQAMDVLCHADVATAGDKGKLRKVPATAGTYRQLFVVEEDADTVDEQLVNVRAARWLGNIIVP